MITIPNEFTIQTGSSYFDYENPSSSTMTLEDIANSLSHISRWGGHVLYRYCVGNHACLVSDILYRRTSDPLVALYGLHHDDHESVRGDIPTPRKRYLRKHNMLFPGEETAEDTYIYGLIGLEFPVPKEIHDEVKWADAKALATERKFLKPKADWGKVDMLPALPWKFFAPYLRDSHRYWRDRFLDTHTSLMNEWKETE